MKRIFVLIAIVFICQINLKAQTQTGCTISFPNNFDDQVNISGTGGIYNPSLCPSGDLILDNANDRNGNSTVTFNEDITLNSLTVNYKNGDNPLEIIVASGATLTVTEDVTFNVSSTPQDKFLTVNGNLDVGQTLDFGNIDFEIDGTGGISASDVIGGGNTTCTDGEGGGTGTCPTFNVSGSCTGGGICGDSALPIELKSFSASIFNNNINLNWITAKEENFSHFELERSLDQNNWEQIGIVQGLGESNSDVYYDFTDENAPFGKLYYRLKSVDIDATFEYSPFVSIENGFEGSLRIMPNPAQNASNLKIHVPAKFKENIDYVGLFDLSGVKIQEFRNFDTQSSLQIEKELKAGMYILKVNHNSLQENIRIIIQ